MPSWHLAARAPYTIYKSPPEAIAHNTQPCMAVDE